MWATVGVYLTEGHKVPQFHGKVMRNSAFGDPPFPIESNAACFVCSVANILLFYGDRAYTRAVWVFPWSPSFQLEL